METFLNVIIVGDRQQTRTEGCWERYGACRKARGTEMYLQLVVAGALRKRCVCTKCCLTTALLVRHTLPRQPLGKRSGRLPGRRWLPATRWSPWGRRQGAAGKGA